MLTRKKIIATAMGVTAAGAAAIGISVSSASSTDGGLPAPTTPIKHVVVIFGENISFDHYFGTYPFATNPPGEPTFKPLPGTPTVNGLDQTLLTANPNLDEPERLDPSQAVTCDQNHGYSAEQSAYDMGLMDKFVQDTTGSGCTEMTYPDNGSYGPNGIVMDYYDGNTVTALWNLAQHFTLGDNSYSSSFGPSTPGAVNLVSGNTNGATVHGGTSGSVANGTIFGDQDPFYDQCSNPSSPLNPDGSPGGVTVSLSGKNVGDLMNTDGVTWGWFEGGFTPSSTSGGRPICGTAHANVGDASTADYVQHHEPFQYYADTSNPDHVSPSSVSDVGYSDPAGTPAAAAVNHQYDLSWFGQALAAGNMPQVSFLKAPAYQDGHAGYSDPLDEQKFLVDTINEIEQSPEWHSTAIIIAYDDSDGWYDHQMGPIIRQSEDTADDLSGPGKCGSSATPPAQNDRCGVGPRQPLLVISPWAKQNYVDSTFTEQASILRFIEDNWNLGRIGNDSADASAGTLDNAFDFNQDYGHAPAIIMNDTTGEITKVIQPDGESTPAPVPAPAPGGSGAAGTSGSAAAGSGAAGSGPSIAVSASTAVKLPKVACTRNYGEHAVALTCTTSGGSQVRTMIRARLFRGRSLIGNVAKLVRNHRARFSLSLGRHVRAGRYTIRLSIDAGGSVGSETHTFRLR